MKVKQHLSHAQVRTGGVKGQDCIPSHGRCCPPRARPARCRIGTSKTRRRETRKLVSSLPRAHCCPWRYGQLRWTHNDQGLASARTQHERTLPSRGRSEALAGPARGYLQMNSCHAEKQASLPLALPRPHQSSRSRFILPVVAADVDLVRQRRLRDPSDIDSGALHRCVCSTSKLHGHACY